MERELKTIISKELEQFHCSILLDEVREKVRRLKAYGVDEAEIVAAMNEEELFPQLVVTEKYEVVLSGEKPVVVEMEPLVKAVYLLFLSHPEGIVLKCLPDYRKELTSIYLLFKPDGLTERVEKSIADITNPTQNSINEKCARIRGSFIAQFDDSLAQHYYIYGLRGEPKKITLPRDLVVWE